MNRRSEARRNLAAQEAAHAAELRRYALTSARVEFERLINLFPELLQRDEPAAVDEHHQVLRKRTLAHWRKTKKAAAKASTNGGTPDGPSLLTALRSVLSSSTVLSLDDLESGLNAAGYKHRGSTPYRTRIAQEARHLVNKREAIRTKRGWKLRGAQQA